MSIELSHRLKTIASYIPSQMHVADIGGDHAFLLLSLAEQGRLRKGIVGEKNNGPFQVALKNVAQQGYASIIDVRLGDGLDILHTEEVDVIVIAGMGGMLIRQILEAGKEKLIGIKRLILQPNNASFLVREWLIEHHYKLIHETIVEENEILYEILIADFDDKEDAQYHQSSLSRDILTNIGPILWEKKHPLLVRRLQEELVKKKRVIHELQQSDREQSKIKKIRLSQEVKTWEEVIQMLSKEVN